MSNPLGKVVPKTAGRRLAIGDVHGCYQTLTALIDRLQLHPEDTLFFLGDYVNKGPSGKQVLDFIASLSSQCQVHAILGNHDKMVLDLLNGEEEAREQLRSIDHGDEFFHVTEEERRRYSGQLSQFHYYFISSEYLLVHAGFDFSLSNPFLGREAMLNIRSFYYDPSKAQNKIVVHGHVPLPMKEIVSNVGRRSKTLPIDNGCVYAGMREGMGRLVCINLDTQEITSQENCD